MGIVFREGHERFRAAAEKVSEGVAAIYQSICPIDARLLESNGQCRTCGRVFSRPPLDLATMTPQDRKQAIEAGLVTPSTEGLSDQESKQAAFWTNYRREHPKDAKPSQQPSLAERASRFLRTEVSYGPKGERIETKRLIEGM